mgnify:CR=1 FL=1
MESFQEWLDFVLDMPLPDDIAAVNFNLFERKKKSNQSNLQVQEALIHRMMTSKEIFVTVRHCPADNRSLRK